MNELIDFDDDLSEKDIEKSEIENELLEDWKNDRRGAAARLSDRVKRMLTHQRVLIQTIKEYGAGPSRCLPA